MKLLYVGTYIFNSQNGKVYGLPSSSDAFFEKYLSIFDSVKVLGQEASGYLNLQEFVPIKNEKIEVSILPRNSSPFEIHNDRKIKKILKEEISKADAILIKPATRRGVVAVKIAKKLKKPYMIEMTGDIHNALKQSSNILKKLYAPIIYRKVKRAISECQYGLYVSESYLQSKYPISGKMCGCADVILEKSDNAVLQKRFEKIDNMKNGDTVKLALIGFYQGNGKGVDIAIRALAQLPENYELSILGNGTEKSRNKWYAFAKKLGVNEKRLHFPPTLPSSNEVLMWLDDYDFFVLPTRSEGFGRCIAEAMSRGCLTLATNICTIPEMLEDECMFEMGDYKKIVNILESMVNDKELMKTTVKKQFEKVQKYDYEALKARRDAFLLDFKNYCNKVNGAN